MSTLTKIYLLLPADVSDFNNLNASPGPKVLVMSYSNDSAESIVTADISGTAGTSLPSFFVITDAAGVNQWISGGQLVEMNGSYCVDVDENGNVKPVVFDSNGDAKDVFFKSTAPAPISADAGTLTTISTPAPNVTSVTNPNPASPSKQEYLECVDKTTIDDPTYSAWRDAMDANQPISTRYVYTISMDS